MPNVLKRTVPFMLFLAMSGGRTLAQKPDDNATRSSHQVTDSPGATAMAVDNVVVEGSLRSRFYYWDWFQAAPGTNNSYPYAGNLFRISFRRSHERMDWQLEFAVPVLLGLPKNSVAPGVQGQLGLGAAYYVANGKSQYSAMLFPKQAFVRFKHNSQRLRLGRFEFLDGSEAAPKDETLARLKQDRISARLIGNFGFTDVQRSFDGMQYLYSHGSNTFTFVGH